ncbi:antibiotic biosynthesis monooxygenase family protein [Mycolicibacterium lutetiense]
MTAIQEHSPHATLINVFTVEPHRATELVELLQQATADVMRHVPGFITANIHLSTDGTRVINYAQWRSAEDFQAMLADPSAREHMGRCADIATSFDPHIYTVESVHEAG